jgi:low affinity Fe/Cu permease
MIADVIIFLSVVLWHLIEWIAPSVVCLVAIVLVPNLIHTYGRARDERLREIIREELWERDNR